RGPRIWPSVPTTRMASGVAITTSKSISPALTRSARSSKPTISAPAALAFSAFSPWANTASRTLLPVPFGSTVAPRTTWSDLRGSTPRFTATSTDSLNLTLDSSLMSESASSMEYTLPGRTFSWMARIRLVSFAMSHALHVDAHAARATRNGAHRSVQVSSRQVRLLDLGDFLELRPGQLADLGGVRRGGTRLQAQRLLDEDRGGRGLGDEREAAVAVDRDHHG